MKDHIELGGIPSPMTPAPMDAGTSTTTAPIRTRRALGIKPNAPERLPLIEGYLKALLEGYDLDDVARRLDVSRRTLERYLSPSCTECPYLLQFAIESLSKRRSVR